MNLLLNILAVAMLPVIFLTTMAIFWKMGTFISEKVRDVGKFEVAAFVAYMIVFTWGIGVAIALCALFVQTVRPYL